MSKCLKLIGLSAIAIMAFGTRLAFADVVINTTTPFSGTANIGCTVVELVNYSGQAHHLITSTIDNTGIQHYTDHIDIAETAVALDTGNTYIGRGEDEFSLNYDPETNTFSTTTEPVNVELIGKGSVPNTLVKNLFHITVNNDGTGFTSFVYDTEVICQ